MTIGTVSSGVTRALGFKAAGISVGIKRQPDAADPPLDLALTFRHACHGGGRVHDQPRAGRR